MNQNDSTVFVTGGTGYLGRPLIAPLLGSNFSRNKSTPVPLIWYL